MIDFTTILYLKNGNLKQQEVFNILSDLLIFDKLKKYNPILTGTIPIEIDIENSDLDIICYCKNLEEFKDELIGYFSNQNQFEISQKTIQGIETIIARFIYQGYHFEIFGQNRPVKEQEAYKHMIIEWEILKEKGEDFRQQIITLKKQGFKTEPAFAKLLGVSGDPYIELLNY